MRRAAAGLLVVAVAAVPCEGRSAAAPGQVCVVAATEAAGLDARTVRAALLVESQKLARPVSVVVAESEQRCPESTPTEPRVVGIVGPEARATLIAPDASSTPLDLTPLAPIDRAVELARTALAMVDGARPSLGMALIDTTEPVLLSAAPVPAEPVALGLGGEIALGGGYRFDADAGHHAGIVEGEAALTLFERRLAIGVAGAWRPEQSAPGEGGVRVAVEGGELLGLVRGGGAVGPVLLRGAAGGGWQWRTVTARSEARFDAFEVDSGAGVLAFDAEAAWDVGQGFFVSATVPVRVYLGGTHVKWQGERVALAPTVSLGVSLRAGVAF
jgi:hypothetical protein